MTIKPLIYYFYVNGSWQQIELPVEITEMRVGTDPDQCEIQMESGVADEVQVLIKRIGQVWYFFDLGKNPMMKVNGTPNRQAQLPPRSSLVIHIGGFIFIFGTKSDKLVLHQTTKLEAQFGPPKDGEFGLKGNNQEIRFPQDSLCIIGSNPLCDFNVPAKSLFCGFIKFSNGNYIFHPLVFNNEIKVTINGLNVQDPVKLRPKNVMVMETYRIDFSTPNNEIPEHLSTNPDIESLALLQVDENGNIVKTYKLPEAGSSIYAGRSETVSHIVIEGSKLISRKHAQIEVFEDKIQLVDIGAKNGLYVNDEIITNVYVHPGDLLSIADITFILGYA